jgi:hypothetical protein
MRGHPLTFQCPTWKSLDYEDRREQRGDHKIQRTGRERPSTGKKKGWFPVAYEYRCSCGRTGWSTHPDVKNSSLYKPEKDPA